MALTVTVATIPAKVVPGQPFAVTVGITNSGSDATLTNCQVSLGTSSTLGAVALNDGTQTGLSLPGSSATTYLTGQGVLFALPTPNGGTVPLGVGVQASDGEVGIGSTTFSAVPQVYPPVKFGPVLDFRYFENSFCLSIV